MSKHPHPLAEMYRDEAGKPYRPANGCEGDAFEDAFCLRCVRLTDEGCPISDAAFWHEIGDECYPVEWMYAWDGSGPTCTRFEPVSGVDGA